MGAAEVPLEGGTANRGLVVRVGDTVRRPRAPGSDGVAALLGHLERAGFSGAPRHLGRDAQGRDVLTYLEGEVATEPYPGWALTDEALASVAVLLRGYHRAVDGFDPSPYTWASSVPGDYRAGIVSHNDPNLDNVVFRDGVAVALIDFDLASPGSALWDVALAARLWVPLRAPEDVDPDRLGRGERRLEVVAEAYGLAAPDRARLAEAALATHDWCYDIVRAGAERGEAGYVGYWTESAQRRVSRGREWLARYVGARTP